MKKIVRILVVFLSISMLLCSCSSGNVEEQEVEKEFLEETQPEVTQVPEVTEIPEVTETSGDQSLGELIGEEPQVEDSGDGWYYVDGMLYVTKIYYRVLEVTGQYRCVYVEPWIAYKNEDMIRDLIIDADMIYIEEPEETKKLAGNFQYGQNSFAGGGPLFGSMESLETITIKKLNLDKITDISAMFSGNSNLMAVDASGLYMSGVKNASYLFCGNDSLFSLNMDGWGTGSLETIECIFRGCSSLTNIPVGSWSTGNIKNFSHAFDGCTSLATINLNGWNITDANIAGMFANCDKLCKVTLSNVSLNNAGAGAMFDEHNSLKSYEFAENWDIGEGVQPIGESCHKAIAVLEPMSMVCTVTIFYNKLMPPWYKEYVEELQGVDDFLQIHESDMMDVFVSRENVDMSSVKGTDILGAVIDCCNEFGGLGDEETELMSGFLQKLDIIMMYKEEFNLEGMNFEEIIDTASALTELTVDEIEQAKDAFSAEE